MFTNTIDNKLHFTNKDGIEMVELSRSIFKDSISSNSVFTYYRVMKDMEMRPDKIAYAVYGDMDYAEMVLKYSLIDNPFAIEEGDVIAVPSLSSVYTDVEDLFLISENGKTDDYKFVKNYHKYIDKSKLPTNSGSSGSGNIYADAANGANSRSTLGSTVGGNMNVVTTLGETYYGDLAVRESYGNVMGYGSDYNLTDGQDGGYVGGNSDYPGTNNLDSNGYPVREGETTRDYGTSPSSNAGGNSLSGGYPDGGGSGKSANTTNNDLYRRGSRGYGQGGSSFGNGRTSTGLINGVSFDDDEEILTETLYDEYGNEVQYRSEYGETPVEEFGPVEPNMANEFTSGITITNGRIYFGDNKVSSSINDITDTDGTNKVDDPMVDCARSGVSLGQFLNATLKNNVKTRE